ncbi:MAG: hypothetical protein IPK99_11880 [Flavobacteriales bacterium]|nr:hypothetical protein [Flavobacteriales bacterium]
MDRLLYLLFTWTDRFEVWFDRRFGWFFTNGMKTDRKGPFKAARTRSSPR